MDKEIGGSKNAFNEKTKGNLTKSFRYNFSDVTIQSLRIRKFGPFEREKARFEALACVR